jgi:hypothetical protein
MRKFLLLIFCLNVFVVLQAQQAVIAILGERVPLYQNPDFDAEVVAYLNWDSEATGLWKDSWYQVKTADGQVGFLSKWDAIERDVLEDPVNPKRISPSAETLFRMMKFFKNRNDLARAEDYAIRIINDFPFEEYPTKDGCFKVAHLSFMYMISKEENGVIYNGDLAGFSNRVIDEVRPKSVLAMAHYFLARYESIHGQQEKALELLLGIAKKFPEEVSRNECFPGKVDTWFYLPRRSKQLFFAIAMIQPESEIASVRMELQRLSAESPNTATRSMAKELLDNLGTMPYQRDQSIWY